MTTHALSPEHTALLAASAISSEVANARGYRTVTTKAELKRLGFAGAQCLTPTLLIPIWGVGGEIALYHHRPDAPRLRDGKPAKYEFPFGGRMALDVHPAVREQARRPDVPLFITEGVRKADAAVSAGLCCLAVIGTWNWRGTNEWGGKTALPDWDGIALKAKDNAPRQVYIVYDSDVMLKESVHQALTRLAAFLKQRGARVAFVYLPHGGAGQKVGLDDFLAAGHTTDELLALATPEMREPPHSERDPAGMPYRETPQGLVWRKTTRDGFIDTPLSNFTARIVADIVEDDGAETRRHFEILAERGGRKSRVSIPAPAFALMNWPMEHLGAGALLYPGIAAKDNARAAIQLLSGDPPMHQVYAHTGWRRIGEDGGDGEWAYLHAAGAIGAAQPVQVRLPTALERFALPDPPAGARLAAPLRASLGLWNLLPDQVSVPLLCAVYRAALGTCDFSLHLAGPSGAFKSELAALAQQHFGAGLDARHLPGSWASTDNALEGLAFAVKDALMVVDDFAPTGSAVDVQRLHAKADRLLRGQGNNAGRLRMRADASLKAPKFPRGLILSTGEDVPLGHSLRARLLVLEVTPGMVSPERLGECQREAAAGTYAEALAGFAAFLAPQFTRVQAGLRQQVTHWRDLAAASGQHRRTPEIAANLALGLHWFLEYALDAGAITDKERESLWKRGWQALGQAAQAQSGHQAASEPTRRFLELLSAALASGRAHLAGPFGDAPPEGGAWGWREYTIGAGDGARSEWRAQGDRIGWIDGGDVYLQKDAAYNVAKRLGADGGDGITLAPRTLNKRLHERGLLASVDEARGTSTVRRTLAGQRHDVLHLHAGRFDSARLMAEGSAQSAQVDHGGGASEGTHQCGGQFPGQFPAVPGPEIAPETAQTSAALRWEPGAAGQNGHFGQSSPTEEGQRELWRP